MAITRYRKLRELEPFASLFDWPDVFADTWLDFPGLSGRKGTRSLTGTWHPSADVYEDGERVIVKMDLPGLSKDEIDVSFDGHILSITGRREEEESKDGTSYWSRERFVGEFHRYVHIPGDVVSDDLSAKYNDGVLEVVLPKAQKAKKKKVAIESGKK